MAEDAGEVAHVPMPLGIAREIAQQGETRLNALMSLATAADLRATTLCGIFGAAAVGVGAAVLAALTSEHPPVQLIWAGAIAASGLFIAAIIAAIAGAPRDFYIGGGNPDALRDWSWVESQWCDEAELLDATAQRHARSIKVNIETLKKESWRVNLSLSIAAASPIVAVIVYFVVPLIENCIKRLS